MSAVGYMARQVARGDDPSAPPAPSPAALRAWREREGLSQSRAASVAGVDIRTWQRWEGSEVEIPHWLADVLHRRWGTAP